MATTSVTEPSSTDLQEINIEMLNDSHHSTSRNAAVGRNQLKQSIQIPADRDTPNTQTGTITVDLKKMMNVRDSGFLDDEDGLSGRDSELTTSRKTPSRPVNTIINNNNSNNKQYDVASEDAPTPNDLIGRKSKSKRKPKYLYSIKKYFIKKLIIDNHWTFFHILSDIKSFFFIVVNFRLVSFVFLVFYRNNI